MRVSAGSLALWIGYANASYRHMENMLAQLYNETQPMERGLLSMLGPTLARIDGYGCWCYFEDDHGKGRGHPANEIDQLCQVLHQGYECAMLDNDEEAVAQNQANLTPAPFGSKNNAPASSVTSSEPCIPWEVDYASGNKGQIDSIVADCAFRNPDSNCAMRSCIVESYFVTNVFQLFFGSNPFDDTLQHSKGFNPRQDCPVNKGEYSPRSCCGLYPFRHPYKTYDGARACCGHKTYDVAILTCCEDDKVRMSCL